MRERRVSIPEPEGPIWTAYRASRKIAVRNRYVKGRGEIVKKAISCKLAEAHGNRTHLGTPSRPHTGFEVREPHQ